VNNGAVQGRACPRVLVAGKLSITQKKRPIFHKNFRANCFLLYEMYPNRLYGNRSVLVLQQYWFSGGLRKERCLLVCKKKRDFF